jgi:hypothetical protein
MALGSSQPLTEMSTRMHTYYQQLINFVPPSPSSSSTRSHKPSGLFHLFVCTRTFLVLIGLQPKIHLCNLQCSIIFRSQPVLFICIFSFNLYNNISDLMSWFDHFSSLMHLLTDLGNLISADSVIYRSFFVETPSIRIHILLFKLSVVCLSSPLFSSLRFKSPMLIIYIFYLNYLWYYIPEN